MRQTLELDRMSFVQVEQDRGWVNMYCTGEYDACSLSFNRTQLDQFIAMLRKARKERREYDTQNLQP